MSADGSCPAGLGPGPAPCRVAPASHRPPGQGRRTVVRTSSWATARACPPWPRRGHRRGSRRRRGPALAGAEIVRGSPPLGFVHPLIGAAILQDVPPESGSCSTASQRGSWRTRGRRPSRWPHISATPRPGDRHGSSKRCGARQAPHGARAPPQRSGIPRAPGRAASAEERRSCCSNWASPRRSRAARPPLSTCAMRTTGSPTRVSAEWWRRCLGGRCFSRGFRGGCSGGAPGGRRASFRPRRPPQGA